MATFQAIIVVSFIALSSAASPLWSDLQVTFGLNPMKAYQSLPRTLGDAQSKGWRVITPSVEDCVNGGRYNGYRAIYQQDSSISLLYDIQGSIAGIQMNINQSSVAVAGNNYRFDKVSMYNADNIEGLPVQTLTAYFVDPSTICSTGRDPGTLGTVGTGTGLFLQNGPTPADLITVPQKRSDAIAQGWTKNRCFVGMGYHNFFESPKFQDSNCQEFRPVFLLYNGELDGELHGFGFASTGKAYSANNRYENPPKTAISQIVGAELVSQCLLDLADSIGLTTMHMYFTNKNAIRYTCL